MEDPTDDRGPTAMPRAEQLAASWDPGAAGYDAEFAGFTGLYAGELLDALGVAAGTRFLDVAAGTGALSVPARARGAVVTATDFSLGMVAVLDERLAGPGGPPAEVAVMDAAALDLPDGGFDAAGSMFGLMFLPDVVRGVSELARVVRPGGRCGTLTWHLGSFPLHRLVGSALAEAVPGWDREPPPPAWAPVGAPDGLRAALEAGGLAGVEVRVVSRTWHFDDPRRFFRSCADWSVPLRPLIAGLDAHVLERAADAFAEAVARESGDGSVDSEALLGVGTVA
jgi:SAM-dependent methyltransferase